MSLHELSRQNVKLVYERMGSGPPVLLIQGLGLPGRMWMGLPGGLARAGCCVLLPDNRGTGGSDAPRRAYSMAQLADDQAAVLEHAGVGPVLCVGISLGGMIAQHLVLRHPDKISGLVLAATSCGLPLGRLPSPSVLLLMLRAMRGRPEAMRRIRELLVHPESLARSPRLFAQWDRALAGARPNPAGFLGQMAAAARHSTCFSLERIRCPTEVITGDSDAIIPPVNTEILARRIPGARLTIVEKAGHAFPLEHPEALVQAIRRVGADCGVHLR